MERCYDIFEVLADDALLWKAVVEGRDAAVLKLHELAANSSNELRLIHLPSNTVVFTIDGLLPRK